MNSHALLRTNVGLTTNVKLMVGSTYSLYLDSIESTTELNNTKFKKFQFNKNNYWDELVPYFFKDTPADIAYYIKYDNDVDNMSTDFANQFDDLYNYGARNIVNNKDYDEDYEYFAPLYIYKNQLPTNFVIFRIDGPGLNKVDNTNFRSEIINKLKCVKVFDLTRKSELGEWLETNITKNKYYPLTPFYMDFRKLEFSSWFGLDYEDGGYTERAFMLDSTLLYENTFYDFEKSIFDGYKNNKIVFPHIINFSFLFNDTPATPTSIRKWSLNRYLGFYLDELNLEKYVSPYLLPKVKSDVAIDKNNILYSISGGNPFEETWKNNDYPYIEVNGDFYKVEKYVELQKSQNSRVQVSTTSYQDMPNQSSVTKYKIISNINLSGFTASSINNNLITIDSNNSNRLVRYDGSIFYIDGFDDVDVWLMQIDTVYHNIIKGTDGYLYLQTDYAFSQSVDKFIYYINSPDPTYSTTISLKVDSENPPKKFAIYKCNFTDIKDFDTDIIDTQFSKHEYIKKDQLTLTDETKMYSINHDSTSFPKDYNDYKIGGQVVNIPVASEYTANGELFRLINDTSSNKDNDLSKLWRKNSERVKWGFQNSISSNDYPYLLNNSFAAEDYNRTTNTYNPQPFRHDRNLDYFLTINSSSVDYQHHSVHVEDIQNGQINTDYKFELDKYLGVSYNLDYFSHFFGKKTTFDSGNIITNTKKWSYFNIGDNSIPNITLFRGLKFKLYDVDGVKINNGNIETINIKTSNSYDGYKFSILLSKNSFDPVSFTYSVNQIKWKIIDNWKNDQIYGTVSTYSNNQTIAKWNDILYQSVTQSQIIDPTINPSNSLDWVLFDTASIFWSPLFDGSNFTSSNNMYHIMGTSFAPLAPLVYNSGEYYYSYGKPGNNFWYPNTYATGSVVLFDNKVWISTNTTTSMPGSNDYWTSVISSTQSVLVPFWQISSTDSVIWNPVQLWKSNGDYSTGDWSLNGITGSYVVYEDVAYSIFSSKFNSQVDKGIAPNLNNKWNRIYSIKSDPNFIYGTNSNSIIELNNRMYYCIDNPSLQQNSSVKDKLDDGINIYINNKYKNVLVNIYVNDNTFAQTAFGLTYSIVNDKISNVDRDDLYSDLFSKLTAHNFMNSINDLSNKYDFINNIKYIVIGEDESCKVYDFSDLTSIGSLPVLLKCDGPDEFISRVISIKTDPLTLSESEIKPKRKLDDGEISSLDQLNYYSGIHLATKIDRVTYDPIKVPNFSGLKNNTYHYMYRHSGFYSPIVHDIQLFKAASLTQSYGNYKFDETLTYFGTIEERIVSKVNRQKNILKLKNNPNIKSIYPMLDEYGYHPTDFFIFKSTWDYEYHIECIDVPQVVQIVANQSLSVPFISNNSNNNLSQL
jgi:hypothetical protein